MSESTRSTPGFSLANVAVLLGIVGSVLGLVGVGGGYVWFASSRDSALTNLTKHVDDVEKAGNERMARIEADAANQKQDMKALLQSVSDVKVIMARLDANVDLLIKNNTRSDTRR
jgi:uncharacterized coiled-coil protein SlyX